MSSSLTNQGTIELDDEKGPLVLNGNLILDATSKIEVQIGRGAENNLAQKLEISGTVQLGGTLEITPYFSYDPQAGNEFEIMTFTSKSGDFAQITGPALKNGLLSQVVVTDTAVTIKVVAP